MNASAGNATTQAASKRPPRRRHLSSTAPARARSSTDADVEAPAQHDVRPPERDSGHPYRREGQQCRPQAHAAQHDEESLTAEDEDRIGVARQHREQRESPEREPPSAAAIQCRQESEEREQAREEEQRVHPPVDALEEDDPGCGGESRRDETHGAVGEARAQERDQRHARDGEDEGNQPQRRQSYAEMRDRPGEQKVEGCPAPLGNHRVHDVAERAAPDEERQRLDLVRRPDPLKPAAHTGERAGDESRPGPENVYLLHTRACARERMCGGDDFVHEGLFSNAIQADNAASVFRSPCLPMNTSAPTGTSSKSSSGSPTPRRRRAPSAAPHLSRRSCIPYRSISAARASTRPTTGRAAARRRPRRSRATPGRASRAKRKTSPPKRKPPRPSRARAKAALSPGIGSKRRTA